MTTFAEEAKASELRLKKDWSALRFHLENMFPEEHLWAHAPYVGFGVALEKGLITREEYEEARAHYRNMWNYVGD